MKLSAVCCTYNRPRYLGELIECFLRQDYPSELRELVILDDAGQYGNVDGNGWKIISIPFRFTSLGEKRNAAASLVSSDSEGILVADDDDLYFSHWFSAHASALKNGDWSCPSRIYTECDKGFQTKETNGIFHACHAFRRKIFGKIHGYAPKNSGEDQDLFHRLHEANAVKIDPCEFHPPFYVCRFRGDTSHLSAMNLETGYRELGEKTRDDAKSLVIAWKEDYDALLLQSMEVM